MSGFAKVALVVVIVAVMLVGLGELLTAVAGSSTASADGEVGSELGEAIFQGKGKCYTCHSIGGEGSAVRCPNLGVLSGSFKEPVGVRAAGRKDGYSAVKYLVESLYDPNAFVVSGYPKGLMTPVHRAPIELNDDEIASVVLFLLSKSEVDFGDADLAEIRKEQRAFSRQSGGDEAPPAGVTFTTGDPQDGRLAFGALKCMQCHKVDGVEFKVKGDVPTGGVGPDLTSIGSIQTIEYLLESLANPNAVVVADPPGLKPGDEGSYRTTSRTSRMPEFGDLMTLRQMLDMAAFLGTLEGEKANAELYPSEGGSADKDAESTDADADAGAVDADPGVSDGSAGSGDAGADVKGENDASVIEDAGAKTPDD